MMSRTHAILETAGEGKTGLYANRTRSQVPIQPSLFGNSNNLLKKAKVTKARVTGLVHRPDERVR